jgi:hypothetical protein
MSTNRINTTIKDPTKVSLDTKVGEVFLNVIDDQAECRRLIESNGMMAMLAHLRDNSVTTGPLMMGERKGFMIIVPGGKMRAYMIDKVMPDDEAMQIIITMAKIGAKMCGAEVTLCPFTDKNN